ASVLPSGETATDMDVPSCTVTSILAGAGAAPIAAVRATIATRQLDRNMVPPESGGILYLPRHDSHQTLVCDCLSARRSLAGVSRRAELGPRGAPQGVRVAIGRAGQHGRPRRRHRER